MSLLRRDFLGLAPALGAAWLLPGRAEASTLLGLSLEELVARSQFVGLCEPVARHAEWSTEGGRRRIVTRTRVIHRETWVASEDDGESELWTWGGRVGRVGQKVHGEARLPLGASLLLFLGPARAGARRVVGLGQGEFRMREEGGRRRLEPLDPQLGPSLIRGPSRDVPFALERLHGLGPSEARALIERSWRELGR